MCDNRISDDIKLKLESPIQYYLEHIDDEEIMAELAWDDPELYQQIQRLLFIQCMQPYENITQCPECRGEIITDEWGEEYCETCGLITRTQYPYVAGHKIRLPYGQKL